MGKVIFKNLIVDNKNGGGKLSNNFTNLSPSKMESRLVIKVELVFDDGTRLDCVVKISVIEGISYALKQLKNISKVSQLSNQQDNYYVNDLIRESPLSNIKLIDNNYLQENLVYKTFQDINQKYNDRLVDDNVLKQFAFGILQLGESSESVVNQTFVSHPDNSKPAESFSLLSDITDLPDFINEHLNPYDDHWDETYLFNITEYSEEYVGFSSIYESFDQTKLTVLTNKTLECLQHFYDSYGFVHWDYHRGNMLCDKNSGNPIFFDFDLSAIDNEHIIHKDLINLKGDPVDINDLLINNLKKFMGNSSYSLFTPIFYAITEYLVDRSPTLKEKIVYEGDSALYKALERVNLSIGHHLDIFRFLFTCSKTLNLSFSDNVNSPHNIKSMLDPKWYNYAEAFQRFLELEKNGLNSELVHHMISVMFKQTNHFNRFSSSLKSFDTNNLVNTYHYTKSMHPVSKKYLSEFLEICFISVTSIEKKKTRRSRIPNSINSINYFTDHHNMPFILLAAESYFFYRLLVDKISPNSSNTEIPEILRIVNIIPVIETKSENVDEKADLTEDDRSEIDIDEAFQDDDEDNEDEDNSNEQPSPRSNYLNILDEKLTKNELQGIILKLEQLGYTVNKKGDKRKRETYVKAILNAEKQNMSNDTFKTSLVDNIDENTKIPELKKIINQLEDANYKIVYFGDRRIRKTLFEAIMKSKKE